MDTAGHGTAIVLGAGIVGLSCALALQRRGVQVTLVDAAQPGAGCSAGNAGMIQVGSSLPLAAPGLLAKVPGMLMDPEGPLSIRWRHLPGLMPWGRKFLQNSSAEAVERNEAVMAGLLSGARSAFDTLLAGTEAHDLIRDRGELYVVRSEDAYREFAAKIEACRYPRLGAFAGPGLPLWPLRPRKRLGRRSSDPVDTRA